MDIQLLNHHHLSDRDGDVDGDHPDRDRDVEGDHHGDGGDDNNEYDDDDDNHDIYVVHFDLEYS